MMIGKVFILAMPCRHPPMIVQASALEIYTNPIGISLRMYVRNPLSGINAMFPHDTVLCELRPRNIGGIAANARSTGQEIHIARNLVFRNRDLQRLTAVYAQIGTISRRLVRHAKTLTALRQEFPDDRVHPALSLCLLCHRKGELHIPIRKCIACIEHLELLRGGIASAIGNQQQQELIIPFRTSTLLEQFCKELPLLCLIDMP